MRRRALLLVPWALGCAAPAPPAPLPPPAPPAAASAAPPASASATPPAPPPPAAPELPLGPPLPLHRFAALVPNHLAELTVVRGAILLRAGARVFSLAAEKVQREPGIEKALAGKVWGAIGGHYPDGLVADVLVQDPKEKWRRTRTYVRIGRGRTTVLGQAQENFGDSLSRTAQQIVELPDGRQIARMVGGGGDGPGFEWLELIPRPKSAVEQQLSGVQASWSLRSLILLRGDGSVVVARGSQGGTVQVITWPAGGGAPTEAELSIGSSEYPQNLLETTRGELFFVTSQALYRHDGAAWRPADLGVPKGGFWPLPGGAMFVPAEEPLVRDGQGTVRRTTRPTLTLEGRELPVYFSAMAWTKAAGLWAVAADGLGLYHERAPREILDLGKPDAGPRRTR